jgi:hypothetical protein
MMDHWLALSDRVGSDTQNTAIVETGLLVFELALPLTEPVLLVDGQSSLDLPRTLALFHDPAAGLILLHRQGKIVTRYILAGPLAKHSGTGRLTFQFDTRARCWSLRLDYIGHSGLAPLVAKGENPLPLRVSDVEALSSGTARARRSSAVLWFGLTTGAELPAKAPWIGQRTPIETPRGPVMAGRLKPGDLVCTADGGLLPLRRVTSMVLPACGSFAPVILRAPFFGASKDILVSSDQMVALSGSEVEYLFGEDEVLVEAASLIDGKSALAEQRRAVASVLMLEFDYPAQIIADGCSLLAARPGAAAPRRILHPYETLTLMALLGRAGHRRVA